MQSNVVSPSLYAAKADRSAVGVLPTPPSDVADPLHRVSLVVPVYRGERTLPTIVAEVAPLTIEGRTPGGRRFVVCEVLLVHDCGPDGSDRAIERLAAEHPFVRPVWLSRNYGQHAATLAGMAGAIGDWVATIDEDGQQDPAGAPEHPAARCCRRPKLARRR